MWYVRLQRFQHQLNIWQSYSTLNKRKQTCFLCLSSEEPELKKHQKVLVEETTRNLLAGKSLKQEVKDHTFCSNSRWRPGKSKKKKRWSWRWIWVKVCLVTWRRQEEEWAAGGQQAETKIHINNNTKKPCDDRWLIGVLVCRAAAALEPKRPSQETQNHNPPQRRGGP